MGHSPDNSTVRVFFALWPTAAGRKELAAWQVTLKKLCGGRAMRGETLHCTLVFVGEIEARRLEALQLAAQEVSGEHFGLCFNTARYWGHNHIVHAAPGNLPQQLAQLVRALEQSLVRHHFKFDRRDYQPHVTLLRNARWTDAPLPAMQAVCWQARDFVLVQSVFQDGLSGYRILARFPLGMPKNRP